MRCPAESCRAAWSDDFLDDIFPPAVLRARRERVWTDQQKSRLPALQGDARRLRFAMTLRGCSEKQCHVLRAIEYNYGKPCHPVLLTEDQISFGNDIFGEGWLIGGHAAEQQTWLRKCGFAECRGFIDSEGKCALCERLTCRDCYVGLANCQEGHKCSESDLAIAAETKPCPTCQVPIYRIDGCYQMWCTQCQTAFSWTTGQVEVGVIHNPHYLEWQRRRGNVKSEGCGAGQKLWRAPHSQHERMLHIANVYYLIGLYSEEQWKRRIYLEMRQYAFERDCEEIHRTYEELGPGAELLAFCQTALTKLSARFGFPVVDFPLMKISAFEATAKPT